MDQITFYKLVEALVHLDPLVGVAVQKSANIEQQNGTQQTNWFFPVLVENEKNGKLVLVEPRQKKREHYHVMDMYKRIVSTLKPPTSEPKKE